MKHKWFYVGLVLSLAFNAGALGLYEFRKDGSRRVRQQAAEQLKPGASQIQLDRLVGDLQKALAPVADTMRAAIKELGLLALEPDPDSTRVNAVLDRIAWAEREDGRLVLEFMWASNRLVRPDLVEFYRNHTKTALDSLLRAESSEVSEPQEPK
jgi:hypothetical protein